MSVLCASKLPLLSSVSAKELWVGGKEGGEGRTVGKDPTHHSRLLPHWNKPNWNSRAIPRSTAGLPLPSNTVCDIFKAFYLSSPAVATGLVANTFTCVIHPCRFIPREQRLVYDITDLAAKRCEKMGLSWQVKKEERKKEEWELSRGVGDDCFRSGMAILA